jgi:S-adenosylmethionine:tRNA ribosyltransferase-isomerase
MTYARKDYHYSLPPELIAQEAAHPHHDARMMVIDRWIGTIEEETTFYELDRYMSHNRVIFFNDSRVIPSRLRLNNAEVTPISGTSSMITEGEIFFLAHHDNNRFEALVKPWNKFKVGNKILAYWVIFHIEEITESWRILRIEWEEITSILKEFGELPLPPYIDYKKVKEEDYQTVFAAHDGSVAAPTASLHFTEALIDKLPQKKEYITLHVWLGTFQWINTDDVRDYEIHSESIEISLALFHKIYDIHHSGEKIVAVWTTVCRTLESLPYLWKGLDETIKGMINSTVREYWDSISHSTWEQDYIHTVRFTENENKLHFETTIYITPGHTFRIVDELITNFHLPESSLLVLVSAFLGYTEVMEIYRKAIEWNYRFYSFGDGMYIRLK